MARRQRSFRRTLPKKGPSAFAPSKLGDGRSLTWESLSGATVIPATVTAAYPTVAHTAVNVQTRFVSQIPGNVVRGVVTLERIRGQFQYYWADGDVALTIGAWPIFASIQLVPLRDGGIVTDSVLSSRNSGDLESNRFIWRQAYYPSTPAFAGVGDNFLTHEGPYAVDVKSRRRFDRALWAMILVIDIDADSILTALVCSEFRALFRATDGL